VLELDCGLDLTTPPDGDFFSLLPPRPAVCLIEPRDSAAQPYLIRTQDLRSRLQRLLGPPDPASKRLNLRDFASGVRYRLTGSKLEQTLTYYQHAKSRFPQRYKRLMRLRPPAVLKVNLRNAYPRCYVTRRVPIDSAGLPVSGSYYGPFASRKSAEYFAGQILDFFKVRRCQIKIRRDPAFPGCIYSEMKMCLAPCFAGCSKEEYEAEVTRLVTFLETGGESLRASFEKDREQASGELDFEKASAFHKKLEKLDEALRAQPELARRIQDLDAVILQRGAEDQSIAVFAIRGGWLAEPFFLRFAELASQPRSAEQLIRERLESELVRECPGDLGENLWIAARWFYGKPRDGEIFFREKEWPYRRILRACSRILSPKAEGAAGETPAATPPKPTEGAA
jgi:excinuclease UvrABC nuclease subunit